MRENFRFPFYLWAMGVTEEELEEHGDRLLLEQLSAKIAASKTISQAVILAMDGYVTDSGELDRVKTQIFVPNDFVARETARYDNLLFGASINPNRQDAVERLRAAHASGAVLVKVDTLDHEYRPGQSEVRAFLQGHGRASDTPVDPYRDGKIVCRRC